MSSLQGLRLAQRLSRPLARLSSTVQPPSVPPQTAPPATTPIVGQAPNRAVKWSASQQSRPQHAAIPRFEQTDMVLQPQPLSAMEMIANEPVRVVNGRRAVCDGGGGPLGHPKIYINLDKPGPKPCGYCGIRFEQARHEHHHH